VSVTPKEAKRGETVQLVITGTPKPGFHTYPLTQRADNPFQDELALSKVIFDNTPGLQPLWPVKESEPSLKQEPDIGYFLEHENPFNWSEDILILPEATPGPKTLKFRIHLQVCDQTCVWGDHDLDTSIKVSSDPAVPLTPQLKERLAAKKPDITVVKVPPADGGKKPPIANAPGSDTQSKNSPPKVNSPSVENGTAASSWRGEEPSHEGLLAFILQGIMWGAISLVTPCVFPMIPITVSFFLKESEK